MRKLSKHFRFLGNLTLSVVSISLAYGIIEVSFRTFAFDRLRTYYDLQAEQRLGHPIPKKGPNEYRIFIFGESAAYGFPVSDRYAVSKWLEKNLAALLPEKDVRVINCGWPGKSSNEILEGARLLTRFEPDVYIMYAGNNEAFTSNRLFLDQPLYRLDLILYYRSFFYRWLYIRLDRLRKHIVYGRSGHVEKQYRNEEIANKIYKRPAVSEEDYRRILARYRENMTAAVRFARSRGVKTVFMNLPSNVREIQPNISEHRALSEAELAAWEKGYEEGKKLQGAGKTGEALAAYEKARTIDASYADLIYRLAQTYEKAERFDEARAAYLSARDLDAQPWRARTELNQEIRKIAERERLPFADVVKVFEENSAHGIVSTDLVFDNVHPSIRGQQLIADEITKSMVEAGIFSENKWRWDELEKSRKENPGEWEIDGSLKAYQPILRGVLSWEAKHYEEAIAELEEGIKLMPDFIEIYGFLANAYWKTGDAARAAKNFEIFKIKDPALFKSTLRKYPELEQNYAELAANPLKK